MSKVLKIKHKLKYYYADDLEIFPPVIPCLIMLHKPSLHALAKLFSVNLVEKLNSNSNTDFIFNSLFKLNKLKFIVDPN